jgi:hypothetical protein
MMMSLLGKRWFIDSMVLMSPERRPQVTAAWYPPGVTRAEGVGGGEDKQPGLRWKGRHVNAFGTH